MFFSFNDSLSGYCPQRPSGFAAGGLSTTLARESIKLYIRSELSARGKAHLRKTARCVSVLVIYYLCPIQLLLPKFAYVSEQTPSLYQERVHQPEARYGAAISCCAMSKVVLCVDLCVGNTTLLIWQSDC